MRFSMKLQGELPYLLFMVLFFCTTLAYSSRIIYEDYFNSYDKRSQMHEFENEFALPVLPNGMTFRGILNKIGNKFKGYK